MILIEVSVAVAIGSFLIKVLKGLNRIENAFIDLSKNQTTLKQKLEKVDKSIKSINQTLFNLLYEKKEL